MNRFMSTRLKNLTAAERERLSIKVVRANRELSMRGAIKEYSLRNAHHFGLVLLAMCGVRIDGLA
ncbi:hypothetical protein [Nocardioides perillae]|uniref:Uncharacterized protein n=1 Tax=Nocardioides perillae TaxID=1119534 RepID=A0A7Y9RPJ5_9ACTN|nr:hypothetical protein [Nocardioides perillae]NYG53965.1 hypothetical protein [Nocardioides perillae]